MPLQSSAAAGPKPGPRAGQQTGRGDIGATGQKIWDMAEGRGAMKMECKYVKKFTKNYDGRCQADAHKIANRGRNEVEAVVSGQLRPRWRTATERSLGLVPRQEKGER